MLKVVRWALLAALLSLAACGTAPAARATPGPTSSAVQSAAPSPSTAPSTIPSTTPSTAPSSAPTASAPPAHAGPYGVFIDGTASTYTVLLIGTDGKTAAQAQATVPPVYRYTHFPPAPPLASLTNSRVYYADGGSIKYLLSDGSTGVAAPYPGGPQTAAGFAVSSDDRRIAVALIAFKSPDDFQPSLDLYVEDLGGGNRIDLFSSTSVVEWPVAWTNGHLVVAGGPGSVGNLSSNPYNGFGAYHVADAASGNRLVTMRSDCLLGPLEPSGTACSSSGSGVGGQAFDGSYRTFDATVAAQLVLVLSPDGSRIAGRPGASGSPIVLFDSSGGNSSLGNSGVPMGWIDDQHLVYYGPNGFERGILDLTSRLAIPIPACTCGNPGVFLGALSKPA